MMDSWLTNGDRVGEASDTHEDSVETLSSQLFGCDLIIQGRAQAAVLRSGAVF
jgi:hypothetical protein